MGVLKEVSGIWGALSGPLDPQLANASWEANANSTATARKVESIVIEKAGVTRNERILNREARKAITNLRPIKLPQTAAKSAGRFR
ncbi:hypothetical protein GCM10022406_02810 [Hymenobacter algoricola]|uniref:Uncharacterized protein n=1 Tax=Hymenobacter algoricola TaxID=486267 RepID=A0ABP7MEV0_9BACT